MTEELNNGSDDKALRYLDGGLTDAEKMDFENQMRNDPRLMDEVEALKLAIGAVKMQSTRLKVKDLHREMMTELKAEQPKVVSFRKYLRTGVMAAAASVLIFLVATQFLQPDANKLYSEAFVDYGTSAQRGNEQITEIRKLYGAGSFTTITRNVQTLKIDNATDSLLVGLSFLKDGRYDAATNWFGPLSSGGPVQQDAEFYLALSLIKNKEYTAALTIVNKIKQDRSHLYSKQFSDDFISKLEKLSAR